LTGAEKVRMTKAAVGKQFDARARRYGRACGNWPCFLTTFRRRLPDLRSNAHLRSATIWLQRSGVAQWAHWPRAARLTEKNANER
jgi:hypothetical protein